MSSGFMRMVVLSLVCAISLLSGFSMALMGKSIGRSSMLSFCSKTHLASVSSKSSTAIRLTHTGSWRTAISHLCGTSFGEVAERSVFVKSSSGTTALFPSPSLQCSEQVYLISSQGNSLSTYSTEVDL